MPNPVVHFEIRSPDPDATRKFFGQLVASGLQVLQLVDVDGQPLITALVSYRDPALAIRCGLPAALP
jgi:predicted enzyme related to lactoylglutathione lyase